MNNHPLDRLAAFLIALLTAAVLVIAPVAAQAPVPEIVATQQVVITDLGAKTDELEKRVEANAGNDGRLADLRIELDVLAKELLKA
ncbi:MAG: hypothetical protein Q7T75_02035, partial [Mesorhizobium sp.]|nr:hypothetical protein [Mesorhizobium sp.]